MTPRLAAVLSLNSAIKNGKFINLELDSAIKKYGFTDKDKSFFTRLLYGTVEKKITLDYIFALVSDVKAEKTDPLVLCTVETGLYQIFYMDRVPDFSACDESAEIAKKVCKKSAVGFVNAVLRNAARKKEEIINKIENLEGIKGISVKYSVPEWMCSSLENDYACAEEIVKAFSKTAPKLTLRVNTLKITAKEFCSALPEEYGAKIIGKTLVELQKSVPINEIYGFDDGLFFVQDASSALCASLISKDSVKSENPVIIDTCACPGGKTFDIAMQTENKGRIYSFDLHKNRLSLIEKGTERLGITSVITDVNDARTPKEELYECADAVLCDVPCSGLGIIAKKPDIRYKSLSDVEKLPEIQLEILKNSAKYVKKGGFIVYSTCTLRKAENEDVVKAFLADNKDFSAAELGFPGEKEGTKTFFPHTDGTDGFFVSKMIRKGK
ncbi:MAG: 16S rRNA (cytosine(967)-C(5))-methyltransferase RsmB [Clostridia bacterium]|nr:16S rRNA (cytosine(967)-C(5))-methyltransferase RsmB [Clostridia bacterium]